MGEVGLDRREYLYELSFWELRAIGEGYVRRNRHVWESARLNAFLVMSAMADLGKAGIRHDTDLVRFPWETEAAGRSVSDDEVKRLQKLMRLENERLARERGEGGGANSA